MKSRLLLLTILLHIASQVIAGENDHFKSDALIFTSNCISRKGGYDEYVQLKLVLAGDDAAFARKIKLHQPVVRHEILRLVLKERCSSFHDQRNIALKIKDGLNNNAILSRDGVNVKNVMIAQVVIQ